MVSKMWEILVQEEKCGAISWEINITTPNTFKNLKF